MRNVHCLCLWHSDILLKRLKLTNAWLHLNVWILADGKTTNSHTLSESLIYLVNNTKFKVFSKFSLGCVREEECLRSCRLFETSVLWIFKKIRLFIKSWFRGYASPAVRPWPVKVVEIHFGVRQLIKHPYSFQFAAWCSYKYVNSRAGGTWLSRGRGRHSVKPWHIHDFS